MCYWNSGQASACIARMFMNKSYFIRIKNYYWNSNIFSYKIGSVIAVTFVLFCFWTLAWTLLPYKHLLNLKFQKQIEIEGINHWTEKKWVHVQCAPCSSGIGRLIIGGPVSVIYIYIYMCVYIYSGE